MTGRLRFAFRDRWTLIWSAVCVLLIATCTALAIALVATSSANDAGRKAQQTVDCVDRILAARAATTERDATAHVQFAAAVNSLFTPARGVTQQEQVAAFQREVARYASTLAADQRFRSAHPLGLC